MCLIAFAVRSHPRYSLVVLANRDEFYRRPTRAACFWPEDREVLGGRDLQGGGTWMAVHRRGRWAAVTNYRDGESPPSPAPSRGRLITDYLVGPLEPLEYLGEVARRGHRYAGFNLLVGEGDRVFYYSNRGGEARELESGVYGLSNHLLDTPWPKVVRLHRALEEILGDGETLEAESLFDVLRDTTLAADGNLPETGIPREWERVLSSTFILTPEYGTRCSTLFWRDREGGRTFVERSFHHPDLLPTTRWFWF